MTEAEGFFVGVSCGLSRLGLEYMEAIKMVGLAPRYLG